MYQFTNYKIGFEAYLRDSILPINAVPAVLIREGHGEMDLKHRLP